MEPNQAAATNPADTAKATRMACCSPGGRDAPSARHVVNATAAGASRSTGKT
jgi:hypothetical protein